MPKSICLQLTRHAHKKGAIKANKRGHKGTRHVRSIEH